MKGVGDLEIFCKIGGRCGDGREDACHPLCDLGVLGPLRPLSLYGQYSADKDSFSQANKPAKKASGKHAAEYEDMEEALEKENLGASPTKKPKKKTVEETYQKLTQLEHVLLRPDTYIGSTEMNRTKVRAVFAHRHMVESQGNKALTLPPPP